MFVPGVRFLDDDSLSNQPRNLTVLISFGFAKNIGIGLIRMIISSMLRSRYDVDESTIRVSLIEMCIELDGMIDCIINPSIKWHH